MFDSPLHFFLHHYGLPGEVDFVMQAAQRTQLALEALEAGDKPSARSLWSSVDGPALLSVWNSSNERFAKIGPRWAPRAPTPLATPGGDVNESLKKQVFQRDRLRCRYCGMCVFTRSKGSRLVALVAAFPELTPGMHVNGGSLRGTGKGGSLRNVDYAKILWSFAAPDHVFPRSLGGPASLENVVTSCSGCNYSKADLTLEQMGVRPPRPLFA